MGNGGELVCRDCGAEMPRRVGTSGRQRERCDGCHRAHWTAYNSRKRREARARALAAMPRRCVLDCPNAVPPGRDYCPEHEAALAEIHGSD